MASGDNAAGNGATLNSSGATAVNAPRGGMTAGAPMAASGLTAKPTPLAKGRFPGGTDQPKPDGEIPDHGEGAVPNIGSIIDALLSNYITCPEPANGAVYGENA
jgi:hypothetical protein